MVDVVEIKSLSGVLTGAVLTLGEVVGFHIDERFLLDGRFDTARAHPLARCGYQDYAMVEGRVRDGAPDGWRRRLSDLQGARKASLRILSRLSPSDGCDDERK